MAWNLVQKAYAQASVDCDSGTPGLDLTKCPGLRDDSVFVENAAYQTPAGFINLIITNLMVIGGVVFMLMMLYAGFKLVQGSKSSFQDAANIMKNAFVGLLLMICAYWIVQVISFLTGDSIPI